MDIRDALDQPFNPDATYNNIVSCVPSLTELLFYLNLDSKLVGVTRFCIHPKEAREKTDVGGTKTLNLDRIRSLDPDLIIANKEENDREQIEALMKEYPVFITFPASPQESITMIQDLITLLRADQTKLDNLINRYRDITDSIEELRSQLYGWRVLVPIWKNPWMSISKNTYIHGVLTLFGLHNVTAEYSNRYPEIDLDEIGAVEMILLPSEPYRFSESDRESLQRDPRFESTEILLVDGSYLSWYGNRTVDGLEYLYNLFSELVNDM